MVSDLFKGSISGAVFAFFISGIIIVAFQINSEEAIDEIPYDVWQEIEKNIISDSQYNFQVMRDLFTPMYNDSVTVKAAGYEPAVYDWNNNSIVSEGSWCFWVNHTHVLNSYYFDNMKCYKVLFPNSGRVKVIESK